MRIGAFIVVFTMGVGFAPAAQADEVTDWTETALRAGLIAAVSPLNMSRSTAIVGASIFEAVNGIDKRYERIYATTDGPSNASRRAAIAQAAYDALLFLYPTQKATFDARLAVALADIAEHEGATAIAAGIDWGHKAAKGVTDKRAVDGFSGPIPANVGNPTIPGVWRATAFDNTTTPPTPLNGAGTQFPYVTPWTMTSAAQFHPPEPPLIGSAIYNTELAEVFSKGRNTSTTRTLDETIYSWFWNAGTASYLWNKAAISLIEGHEKSEWDRDDDRANPGRRGKRSLLENARLIAQVDLAMADAAIGCWEAKYVYMKWRPISAIRAGLDPTWSPLFATPNHPEYPSGHSCVSGAAGAVLAAEFGERTRFQMESDAMIGVVRSYRSFGEALEEVKNARIFAGIHFRSACDAGQTLGRSVALQVLETAMQPRH